MMPPLFCDPLFKIKTNALQMILIYKLKQTKNFYIHVFKFNAHASWSMGEIYAYT